MNIRRYDTIALGLLKNKKKKKEECQIVIFYLCGAYVNCTIIAMSYTYLIENQL